VRRSTERYRAVIEHADEGMIVMKDERIAYANARAADIAGMQLGEMRSAGFLHRIHPDDHPLVLERQRRRLAGEPVPSRYELRLLLPDGEIRWIGISVTVVPWDGEQAILTFFSDISRAQTAGGKTARHAGRARNHSGKLAGGHRLPDARGRFRWSNQAMAQHVRRLAATAAPPTGAHCFRRSRNTCAWKDIAELHGQGPRLPERPADAQAGRQPVLGHGVGQGGERLDKPPGQRLDGDGHHPAQGAGSSAGSAPRPNARPSSTARWSASAST
jgi:PAS domain S-box-containing protein